MTPRVIRWLGVLGVCCLIPTLASAQLAPHGGFAGRVDLSASHTDWQLPEEDWHHYRTLMRGPAGLLYPTMTPYYVLSVYADDETRQRALAEKDLDFHLQRFASVRTLFLLQTDIAKDKATLPPTTAAVPDAFSAASNSTLDTTSVSQSATPAFQQHVLFTRVRGCQHCDLMVKAAIARGRVDIYFVDTTSDDQIRDWATTHGVTATLMTLRSITLNHDDAGVFEKLGGGQLPRLYQTGERG